MREVNENDDDDDDGDDERAEGKRVSAIKVQ